MPKEPKKLALLYILKILETETDADHPLTQEAIAERLFADYEITLERKAVGRNLAMLAEAGHDVISTPHGVYLGERTFEPSELRLLIDGVLFSRHIHPRQARRLAERLAALGGRHFRSGLGNVIAAESGEVGDSAELFYAIDLADEAIAKGRQIAFTYRKYGADKRLHKSSEHTVSPYAMLLRNQHYFLMAYSEAFGRIAYFRMDKLTALALTETPATPLRSLRGYENGIDRRRLSSALPYMYADEPIPVVFSAAAEIIDQVVDWFGKDFDVLPSDGADTYRIAVRVSPTAMRYWAMQYCRYVRILSPASLRESVAADLRAALEGYASAEEKSTEKTAVSLDK